MRIPLRRAPGRDQAREIHEPDLTPGRTSGCEAPLLRLATPEPSRIDSLEREILGHAARTARLRFIRGRLAAVFLARKSWSPLGFVRVGDYSRERLGVAARTLQQEAQVCQALERLPRTTAAFLESRLSWTQIRLITAVARASDEASWIDSASSSDTRALAEKVRAHAPASHLASDNPEDQPATRFNVRISRRGRRYWRAACEMAERTAGSTLTHAQVLELVAAEAASGAPHPAGDAKTTASRAFTVMPLGPDPAVPPSARPRDPELQAFLRSVELDPCDGPADPDRSAVQASGNPAEDCDRDPALTRFLAEWRAEQEAAASGTGTGPHDGSGESFGADSYERAESNRRRLVREHSREIAIGEDLPWLVPHEPGNSPTERLEAVFAEFESREPATLDARMREVGAVMQRADAALARLFREALDARVHRVRGFESFASYVEHRLGFCPRTAWTLIAIDRAAARVGGNFARACHEGHLSLLAARTLLPVLGSQHLDAWIERAGTVTLRRLEAEVAWALDARDAASGADAFDAPAPPPLDADLSIDAHALLDADALKMRALGETTSDASNVVPMRVTLSFSVPLSVAGLAEEAMLALRKGSESRGEAFERMLAVALLEWTSQPRHRDPVFERDGWRCAVPACSSRRELHDHHIRFRSEGGDDALDNRITVCAAHHLNGIHMGRIRATGQAPWRIVWEIGCRQANGKPLIVLVGDRYVVRPAMCSTRPAAAEPNSTASMPSFMRKIA